MLTAGELPNFSLGDYIETGIFEPAHRLLTTHGRDRGDVRFSILHPDQNNPTDFTMTSEEGLLPALGHSMEGRQQFRIPIDASFSGYAYRTGRTQVSNDLKKDDRWTRHPMARQGRDYESMVSVPLVLERSPDGVLNVLATRARAFERVDQTYITLLGSVIDLARSVSQQWD